MVPANRRYTGSHEWVLVEGERATIGITDFAVRELGGSLNCIDLPKAGRELAAGDVLATVDSNKASAEIYAPVSGRVIEVNVALEDPPNLQRLAEDPYGYGWICRIRMKERRQLKQLLHAAAYEAHIGA